MPQPTFIQKVDGSNANANSLALTLTTTAGNMLLVGVILNANGAQSKQTVAGITDSAGDIFAGSPSIDTGVAINTWRSLGTTTNNGIHIEWWACKTTASITSLVINLTGLQSIIAFALEYSGTNGITKPIFQAILASQNTITTLHIRETASTFPNSGSELMIGLFAMIQDTFNAAASAPPGQSVTEVVRSTNSLNIPPALSYQVIEQGTVDTSGLLNVNAVSATELATALNVATSSMQCFWILISGGLVLNTQPGFSDQPDSSLVAGKLALGLQLAKISGNAALGMCRMEFFQGVYKNGETVDLPVSPVDGYQYQRNELTYLWGIYSSADTSNGWISGPGALWFCQWNVDQTTGDVISEENYRTSTTGFNADFSSGNSNDGWLIVYTIAQRQKNNLTVSATPSWTQLQSTSFIQDLAHSQDVLQSLNDDAKLAVIGQELIEMGEFYQGQTVPRPVSPADGYTYAYAEVKFVFSWRWTTSRLAYVQPPASGGPTGYDYFLASLHAAISSVGVVTCAVGFEGNGGDSGYYEDPLFGRITVFAFCQRSRTGAPSSVAKDFAEIPNSLFYPGSPLPASIGAQLVNNINEAALSPEFFGPTLYAPGSTIPTPVSPVDGYAYSRSELVYLWDWGVMIPGPYPGALGDHDRCALFAGDVNQSTGAVTVDIWRLAPGGPYVEYTTPYGQLSVLVIGLRSRQQNAFTTPTVQAPSDAGSATADIVSQGVLQINGV